MYTLSYHYWKNKSLNIIYHDLLTTYTIYLYQLGNFSDFILNPRIRQINFEKLSIECAALFFCFIFAGLSDPHKTTDLVRRTAVLYWFAEFLKMKISSLRKGPAASGIYSYCEKNHWDILASARLLMSSIKWTGTSTEMESVATVR